ncbi:MAG: ATPase, T2SS/T4P/T4SS family, partial [Candidatus Riflebacteria bacterium]
MAKEIEKKLKFEEKLRDLTFQLLSCTDVAGFLLGIREELLELFNVEAFSIFIFDKETDELRARYGSNNDLEEIHIPVSPTSLAGYVAQSREVLQINDAYNADELRSIAVGLKFDKRWDQANNFRTRSVLAVPLDFKGNLLGVIQLINKLDGEIFTTFDRSATQKFAKTLALAMYNVERVAQSRAVAGKFDYLVLNNNLTHNELIQAMQMSRTAREPLESILEKRFNVDRQSIHNALSFFYKKRFVPYSPEIRVANAYLQDVKPEYLRKHVWVPVHQENDEIAVLVTDPNEIDRMDSVKTLMRGGRYSILLSSQEDIYRFIDQWELGAPAAATAPRPAAPSPRSAMTSPGSRPLPARQSLRPVEQSAESFIDGDSADSDGIIVRLANQIIEEAYLQGISDIHIEPYRDKETLVRFRKDGSCFTAKNLPYNQGAPLISRFKIMANIDISQRRIPQDGKIKTTVQGQIVELRVATMPTVNDQEDAVLRILASAEPWPLEKLNIMKYTMNQFKQALDKPYGMILVVGPTGSGKTTTLHAGLGYLNHPQKKIWTAEDPVEITQYGLRQVQINNKAGLTFAAAMRSFLRANPDVIMVGEMRDLETASIAIEASLTGHLVLSTLHTNSAPETVNRLLDMGLEPIYFAEALIGIMAQRLVKTFCSACRTEYKPTMEEKRELIEEFGPEIWNERIKIPLKEWDSHFRLYKANGCDKCNFTGYSGRMGIYEYLSNTDELKRLIHGKARVADIRQKAMEQGMWTLKMDGITKVLKGETSLQQILAAAM